jgi:diphthine synthase
MEEAKKADRVYIELYTSRWHGDIKNLEKIIDKKIEILTRKDLEENSEKIIEQAKNQSVAILIQGDALVQTTHTSLIQEAKKLGIETRIIHNTSIISAIGETGLHPQKFGPYVTIPFPEKTKNKMPESIYETIKMNKSRGLHTLCLLDVVAEENKYMSVNEAMKILLTIEGKRKEGVFTKDTEVVVFARAGSDKKKIICGKVENLLEKDFGEPPVVLIITGILHFTEKETLSLLYSEE